MASSKLIAVFDKDDLFNNAVPALSMDVEEVFSIHHHEIEEKYTEHLSGVIHRHKNIRLNYVEILDDEHDIDAILEANPGIIVDVGGEKYLSLVLFHKVLTKDNPIIYYDDEENRIKFYRSHTTLLRHVFSLSIKDLVALQGGEIRDYMHKAVDQKDESTRKLIDKAVSSSVGSYSRFTSFISKVNSVIAKKQISGIHYALTNDEAARIRTDDAYYKYADLGLLKIEGNRLSFPSRKIASLFEVSGAFLENYLYMKLTDSGYFDDVMMSAVIDFSGDIKRYPVVCEIDCLVLKDNRLLFVSCKSNKVDTAALNEIKVHNTMFGNSLSYPVLCTLDDLDTKSPSVYGKGRELSVAIIDRSSFEEERLAEDFLAILEDRYTYEKLPD